MSGESRGFSGAAVPVWGFSQGTTGSSGSLSCGVREVKSPYEWRGGARHCSRVMVVESGLNAMKKDARCLSRVAAGNPVGEGTKRRGTDTPMHLLETPAGSTHSLSRALRPPERLKRQAEFRYSDKTRPDSPVPTLQGPCGRSPKRRGSLRCLPPLEVRPSSVAPDPAESRGAPPPPQDPSPLRGTLGSSLRSPAEGEGPGRHGGPRQAWCVCAGSGGAR